MKQAPALSPKALRRLFFKTRFLDVIGQMLLCQLNTILIGVTEGLLKRSAISPTSPPETEETR